MTFLYPTFLWALATLSIPVIIHLFNFRKTTRVYFSSTRFLKQVKEATTAKRRLKHYLILCSRILFLLFLVITFAQPIIPAREHLGNAKNVILYIDNSLSMSAQLPDKTKGLDAALQHARSLLKLFPGDTRYKLITNDFAPYSNTFKTKAEIEDLLTQIRFSPVSRTLQEVKERITQDNIHGYEIFWISDFQKSTFGNVRYTPSDSLLKLHLVPLDYETHANVFVDSAFLENPFAARGEKNALRVLMRNAGNDDVEQLNLKLVINGIQAGTTAVNIKPNSVTETSFDLTTGLSGLNKAKINFNDFPVSFDNDFFLTLNFTNKINVVEVRSNRQPSPVEKVFGNKQVFDFKAFDVSNVNYSFLSQADLVVINGLNTIDASLALAIRHYIDNFGTVLLVPGPTPDVNSYRLLLPLQAINSNVQVSTELDRPDFNNPFFENVFEEKSVALAMPKATKILSWGGRSAILNFKNGEPFLSLFDQKGKLYVLASPLEQTFTDFQNNALFVPVMYRVAASGKKDSAPLYHTLTENFIALTADSLTTETPLKLIGDQEIVPAQRKVGENIFIDLPKFSLSQGFYKVVASRDTIGLLAFNLGKAESLLDQYTAPEVKVLLGNGDNITLFEPSSVDTFSNEIKARYLGRPLWKYALLAALFFLLAEILLIRFLK